ncbi:hypothetical protein [Nocardia arthritidis]|uniref:Uncharacterized protein n=1 Tax=Nocardia arthritidis TaxID=228602 RepID=A0A6G9YKX6_9NOCA|nr:hypothetical protein [Nocardia arthritidis]QIS13919.1 hypothetical protein F5544_30375 [Nocardia arthritidis]
MVIRFMNRLAMIAAAAAATIVTTMGPGTAAPDTTIPFPRDREAILFFKIENIHNPGEEGDPEPYLLDKEFRSAEAHPFRYHPWCQDLNGYFPNCVVPESPSTATSMTVAVPVQYLYEHQQMEFEIMEADDSNGDDFLGTITWDMLIYDGTFAIKGEDGHCTVTIWQGSSTGHAGV